MPDKPNVFQRFWKELKRRNVHRVLAIYAGTAFVILEAADIIFPRWGLPDWTINLVLYLLLVGLVITSVISWIYDITPEGIKRTKSGEYAYWDDKSKTSNAWKVATFASIIIIVSLIVYNIWGNQTKTVPLFNFERSLAIIPFENWSHSEEFSHLGDAIANEICTQSSKIHDLQVMSFTSTSGYKGLNRPSIKQIGKELGAKYIVEGSVERQGEDISIHVQVIDAEDDKHVWADEFKGKWDEIFTFRSKIAVDIAKQLEILLTNEEIKEIEKDPTNNSEAYNYFLKGNYYLENYYSMQTHLKAVEMYEKAVELDSQFLLAYVKLVVANTFLYVPKTWDHTPERLDKAKTYLEECIEIDPGHPDVHYAKGYFMEWIDQDFNNALDEYKIALRERPNNSDLLYSIGIILLRQGKAREAVDFLIKRYKLDPKTREGASEISWAYMLQGEWEEALKWIDIAISVNPEGSYGYYKKIEIYIFGYGDLQKARLVMEEGKNNNENFDKVYYPWMIEVYSRDYQNALKILEADTVRPETYLVLKGQVLDFMQHNDMALHTYENARLLLEKLVISSPDNAWYQVWLGLAHAGLGNKEEAKKCGLKAIEMHPIQTDPWSSGEEILLEYAQIKILVGEYNDAIDLIETLIKIPSLVSPWRLKLDPIYDPVRHHPGFQKIVQMIE